MDRVRHPRLSAAEKAELWRRWKRGESVSAIGRALGRIQGTGYHAVSVRGGVPPAPRRRSRWALTLAEREAISPGRGLPVVLPAHRRAARARALDGQPRGAASQIVSSGDRAPAADVGRRQARGGLVSPADRRVAQTALSERSWSARVARDDLPESVCPEPGRPAAGATDAPLPASADAAGEAGALHRPAAWSDRRRRVYPGAPSGGGGPRRPRPVGR